MNRPPSELERTVTAWRTKGLAWVEAKLAADLLEKDRDSFLAAIIGALRKADPTASNIRLEVEATASAEYRDYIKGMVLAKHKELTARVEYDAYERLFSARQSDQSLERTKIEKGIFLAGG